MGLVAYVTLRIVIQANAAYTVAKHIKSITEMVTSRECRFAMHADFTNCSVG